jgi:hypothetical protein
MKTKILITESQYQKLLNKINEQNNNWSHKLTVRKNNAPGWLTDIIGNKEDGYQIKLPQSDDTEKLNQIISDGEVESYIKDKELNAKIQSIVNGINAKYWRQLTQINPKYKAAILKLYKDSGYEFKSLILNVNKSVDVKTPDKPKPEDVEQPKPRQFPLDGTGKQYFADNEWVLNNNFKEDFQNQILNKLIQAKKDGVFENLNTLTIQTSCSRLRNGVPQTSPGAEKWKSKNKRISFIELSTERNNAAKQYILSELSKIGVNVSNVKLSQDIKGENGDGTSGGDFTQGSNRDDFTKNKYLKIYLGFNEKTQKIVEPEKTDVLPTKTKSYVFNATLISPDVPYKIPGFDWVPVWNPKTKSRCKKQENGQMECEKFEGNKNDFWKDPKLGLQ